MSDEISEDRKAAARDALENLMAEFTDVLAPNAEMPMLANWVLLVCHDDAADSNQGAFYKLNRRGQWTHQTVGLLLTAADDYRSIVCMEEP